MKTPLSRYSDVFSNIPSLHTLLNGDHWKGRRTRLVDPLKASYQICESTKECGNYNTQPVNRYKAREFDLLDNTIRCVISYFYLPSISTDGQICS